MQKEQRPQRIWVDNLRGESEEGAWFITTDDNCDSEEGWTGYVHAKVVESELARVRRERWNEALDAAIQVVNDARVEGGELREVRERIRGLKARDGSEGQG